MQETVTTPNERKSLFSSFLEVLEAKDRQAQADRQLQEERYMRRTQRIYDLHERQVAGGAEVRRCAALVGAQAAALEAALRGADVPLAAALALPAAALQRLMAQCVANAARIRPLLAHSLRPQMDALLAKMEAELSTWTVFVQRAADATYNSEVVIDNLHNMIAEQRRCVREVQASAVCGEGGAVGEGDAVGEGEGEGSPAGRRAPSAAACSTPLARD